MPKKSVNKETMLSEERTLLAEERTVLSSIRTVLAVIGLIVVVFRLVLGFSWWPLAIFIIFLIMIIVEDFYKLTKIKKLERVIKKKTGI